MIKLDKNEKVVLEVRKHWFILLARTLFLVFFIFLPIILMIGIKVAGISEFITLNGESLYIWITLTSLWLLFVWIIFFVIWTDHYLDILIITNKKIVDIEQKGLFHREISTFRLDRMQDITIEIHGFIATLLDFGDVNIQTAGESREFIAKSIPNPTKVKKQIWDAYNKVITKNHHT